MATSLVLWSYICCTVAVTVFGLFALAFSLLRRQRHGKDSTEFFLTARRSAGVFRIAWSLYAASLGSWALFSTPSYAYQYGIIGLTFYSVSCGFPFLFQSFLGNTIARRLPNVTSFSHFIHQRFGTLFTIWITLIMMLNMGIALTIEMTGVGDLFSDVIGVTRIPIVITIAFISMIYTAGGGLHVSIVTDQVQAGLGLVLLAIVALYVAVTFREPLPTPLPKYLGPTYLGYASIATMPISLTSFYLFSEAIWQRCWAASSEKTLRLGAFWAAGQVTIVVFLLGFGGFIAAWSGKFVPSGPNDYGNTIFFSLLKDDNGYQVVWITVVVAIFTVILSESAQDSLQNGLADCISGVFLRNQPVTWSRLLVLVFTVPCLFLSLQGYNINSLYLTGNLVTTTSTVPVLAGLLSGELAELMVTPITAMLGCLSGFFSVVVYAAIRRREWGLNMSDALHLVFFDVYDWPPFLIGLVASGVGLLVGAAIEIPLRKCLNFPSRPSALSQSEHKLSNSGLSRDELKEKNPFNIFPPPSHTPASLPG